MIVFMCAWSKQYLAYDGIRFVLLRPPHTELEDPNGNTPAIRYNRNEEFKVIWFILAT